MILDTDRTYAVLTGDIVESSKLPFGERENLREVLVSSSKRLLQYFGDCVPYMPDIFRGDSWQFFVSDPLRSLRVGLFFRSLIRGGMTSKLVDTRISIGFGTIEFVPEDALSSGDGEAFQLSGEALERIPRINHMAIAFPKRMRTDVTEALDLIVKLIDLQARNWTKKQAMAISGALLELTQEEIADQWFEKKISQQAIGQHLERAGWSTVARGIHFFEQSIPKIIRQ